MGVDRNGRPHRPGGLPQGYAGTFDRSSGLSDGDVLPPDPLLAMASESLRVHAMTDHTRVKSASETRGLLDMADHVEYGPDGAILYDGDGNILFREDPAAPGLDANTMGTIRRRRPRCAPRSRRTWANTRPATGVASSAT